MANNPQLTSTQRRQAHLSGLSSDIALNNQFSLTGVANRPLRSALPAAGAITVVADTAYWVYIGQTTQDVTANYVHFWVQTEAVGTRVQELVVASTAAAPNRGNQTLTVLGKANATGDYTAATGDFANTTALGTIVPAGTYLWAGCRFALTSTPTQPTIVALVLDQHRGEILSTASAGVLAVGSTYTGAIITQSTTLTTVMAPDLSLVLA